MDSSSSEAFSLQNHLRSLSVHLLLFCLISFYFQSSYLQHITPPLWALIHLLPTLAPDHSVISTHSPQPDLICQSDHCKQEDPWRNLVTTVSLSSYMSRTSPTPDFLVQYWGLSLGALSCTFSDPQRHCEAPSGRLYTPPSTLMKQTSHLQRSFSAWSHTAADWSSPLLNRASTTRSRLQGLALYIL